MMKSGRSASLSAQLSKGDKMTKFFVKGLALITILLAPHMAMAEGANIIVFDPEVALANSDVGKDIIKQVQAQAADLRKNAEKQSAELQGEADKLKEQQTLLAPDALKVRVDALRENEMTARQEIAVEGQSIEAGRQKASREVLKIMDEELDKIAKERAVDIVMNRKAVFYASPSIDVTRELVERLNGRIKTIKVTPVKVEQK
jgi:Skp family chaperone for outer membrane proteins